jgi:peptidoglycan/LPS O-acetylase OafA/YrhL
MSKPKHFVAIEGLRGWLAWAVVLSHIAYFSNLRHEFLWPFLRDAGLPAVRVFIILSGFVITHLLIERPESYPAYLTRRFMRIFPLFAITCFAGYFANDLHAALLSQGFGDREFAAVVSGIAASNYSYLWSHVLAHLTMLHSAISNSVLPFSEYAFNMPAWSLSLEWQFYLIAPFAVLFARRAPLALMISVLILVAQALYRRHWSGSFLQPGLLFASAEYFAIGIASRFLYPVVAGRVKRPELALALIIVFYALIRQGALLVWLVTFLGLVACPSGSNYFHKAYKWTLESRVALYFGSRSFSIYLSHVLIIAGAQWFWLRFFSGLPNFLALAVMTLPATLITAEFLYRYVELPGIRLGSLLARRFQSEPVLSTPMHDLALARVPIENTR